MVISKSNERLSRAAETFDTHVTGGRGFQIAQQLAAGLGKLTDAMFTRIHADVEREFGVDSMLMPLSELKSEQLARREIGVYQLVESSAHATERGYVSGDGSWYTPCLIQLLLGQSPDAVEIADPLEAYREIDSLAERRRQFSNRLETALPEARRMPLVAYQLLPLATKLATSLAFGDQQAAYELRRRQQAALSSIEACPGCRGQVLEIGETCTHCGNPFWNYKYLTAG